MLEKMQLSFLFKHLARNVGSKPASITQLSNMESYTRTGVRNSDDVSGTTSLKIDPIFSVL